MIPLARWTEELAAEVVAVEGKVKIAQEAGIAAGIEAARSLVPVLTGATRDSIGPDGEGGYGAGTDYAGFVENGTSDTAPQPFVGPSSDMALEVFAKGIVLTVGP